MNKELIKQLLEDGETRARLAVVFGQSVDQPYDPKQNYDEMMRAALNKLNDEPTKGEQIMVETSSGVWEIGRYICTQADGRMAVITAYYNPKTRVTNEEVYVGKHIKLERSEMSE